eukprot:Skav205393  [mRNA]  locus=scaffold1642:67859:73503:+ [translate_table: standard]
MDFCTEKRSLAVFKAQGSSPASVPSVSPACTGSLSTAPTMERVKRIAGHVNGGITVEPCSAAIPVMEAMKTKIAALAGEKTAFKNFLLKYHGERRIQNVTVEMAINGARAVKSMVTETSDLDANLGIAYRHLSLYDVNNHLPKAPGGNVALPEGAFWLLAPWSQVTGEEPSPEEVKGLTEELHKRSAVPANVMQTIDTLPLALHLKGAAVYWVYALEDALDIIAKIPTIAAKIYRRTFQDGVVPEYDKSLDWAANFAQMLGVNQDEGFKEAVRF